MDRFALAWVHIAHLWATASLWDFLSLSAALSTGLGFFFAPPMMLFECVCALSGVSRGQQRERGVNIRVDGGGSNLMIKVLRTETHFPLIL